MAYRLLFPLAMTYRTIARLLTGLLAVVPLASAARTARAQGQAPPLAAAAPTVEPPATTDPNLDRGFLLPTAMTQPKGSVTYNNYELLLHGVTFGITDELQASVTVLSPLFRDMPIVALGALKWRLFHNQRIHVALQASGGYLNSRADGPDNAFSVGTGAFASVCLRDDCSSLLSASGTYQFVTAQGRTLDDEPTSGQAHALFYGMSLVHRVAPHVKLLVEISSLAGRARDRGFDNVEGALAGYGVRFHNNNLGADLGFVRPIGGDDDGFLMGLPFVNVSYRWR